MAIITSNGTGGGNSTDTAAWTGGVVPTEGVDVQVRSGDTITLTGDHVWGSDSATPAIDVLSGGTLRVNNPAASYTLTAKGDLYVRSGGTLSIDMSSQAAYTFTVRLNYSAALAANKYSCQIIAGATIVIAGRNKVRAYDTLSAPANAAQNQVVTTNDNSAEWRIGDRVILSPSPLTGVSANKQITTISNISGTTITLTYNLTVARTAGTYIVNTTRNVMFLEYNDTYGAYVGVNSVSCAASWVQFWLGYDYWNHESVSFITAGKGSLSYCSIRGRTAVMVLGTSASGGVIDHCVLESASGGPGIFDSIACTGWTFNANVLIGVASLIYLYQDNTNHVITNNICFSCSQFLTVGYKTIVTGWTITGNVAFANSYGIYRLGLVACQMANNDFRNNAVQDFETLYGNYQFTSSNDKFNKVYLGGGMDAKFLNLTEVTSLTNALVGAARGYFYQYLAVTGAHKTLGGYGTYELQSVVRYGTAACLLMSPTNASNELSATSTIFAKSGQTVSYSCYMRKSAAMAVLPYVELSGAGVTVSRATMTNSTDTWELLTVSGVPSEDGFCQVKFACQNASRSVYVDDDAGSFGYWFQGDIPSVLPKPSLTTLDILNAAVRGTGWSSGTLGDVLSDMDGRLDANVSSRAAPADVPTVAQIVAGVLAGVVETGKTLQQNLRDLWAVICGQAAADLSEDPTEITYKAADGVTTRITHTLTDKTRQP